MKEQLKQYFPVVPAIKLRLVGKGENKFSAFIIDSLDRPIERPKSGMEGLLLLLDTLEAHLDALERDLGGTEDEISTDIL